MSEFNVEGELDKVKHILEKKSLEIKVEFQRYLILATVCESSTDV